MDPNIKISTQEVEGKYQASKWMHLKLFISKNRLKELLDSLGFFQLFYLSKLGSKEELQISSEQFIDLYEKYIESLSCNTNTLIDKKLFSLAIVKDRESIYLSELKSERFAVRLKKPCVQISLCDFFYDPLQQQCFFNQHAKDSIQCGLEFSFPHFYQDPHAKNAIEHFKDVTFSHSLMFKQMQRWAREFTDPLWFKDHEKIVKSVVRVDKNASCSINQFYGFRANGLFVINPYEGIKKKSQHPALFNL